MIAHVVSVETSRYLYSIINGRLTLTDITKDPIKFNSAFIEDKLEVILISQYPLLPLSYVEVEFMGVILYERDDVANFMPICKIKLDKEFNIDINTIVKFLNSRVNVKDILLGTIGINIVIDKVSKLFNAVN